MKAHQKEFLDLAMEMGALRFGEFTLKSGRVSPYFFNAGLLCSGRAMAVLGRCYAQSIADSGLRFDMIFGPAYKGIPLAAVTVAALADTFDRDPTWAYNRKEAKEHGEGGIIVGAPLAGRVLILDDVITAGTAIREAVAIIRNAGAEAVGVAIALDREERGQGELSAVQEVEKELGMEVIRIVGLADLIAMLAGGNSHKAELAAVSRYRDRYGSKAGA
ncbi:MAG: orotate phosphoribosyltransferase [Gammaproteobacteria bacterium]|nr:orotate phosphoribosyltransferase [Pseudomonadota bacterium]MCZ6686119.1 orotate phosphoribosyltransferase [Gammaproteobacteria bacterium]MCZ6762489.1 orotate phosphoribosyltransferase [Gammaproteobacteria bacterium]